jgi:hypothetical protein
MGRGVIPAWDDVDGLTRQLGHKALLCVKTEAMIHIARQGNLQIRGSRARV